MTRWMIVAFALLCAAGVCSQTLETNDGLRVDLADGEVGLRVGDEKIGAGIFFHALDYRTGEEAEGVLVADGTYLFPGLDLLLTTNWIEEGDHLRFEGSLQNLRVEAEPERAITLSMGIDVDPTLPNLAWDDDIRTTRDVVPGETYQNTMPNQAGSQSVVARYPLACIHGDGWGLALANPIDEPRVERILLDADLGRLAIEWDLGISNVTEHFPNSANVEALIYTVDPDWGFRDAWRRFCALQPEAFTVRQERQGNWMPFTQIDTVERPADFGFGVHEYHLDVSIEWNRENGVASLIYTEPVVHWLNMPGGMERTYEQFMAYLRTLTSPKASSLITSGCFGPDQIFTQGFFVFPWANGARVPTNPDPEVSTTPRAPNNRFDEDWGVIANALGWNGSGLEGCDGVYFDSFEGWDMDDLNYRRDHWRTVDWPLTFDLDGNLAYPDMFHALEYAAEVSRRLHPEGLLTMANTVPYRFVWSTAWLDILGIETSWGVGEELVPPPQGDLDWTRTLCGAKPYCWLQNVPFEQFRGEKVVGYFEQCLFYGFYPSFFSHDAANDPYWENPALYNADRSVFLRLMPAIRRVGESGWRPVTHARTSDPAVLIERFGEGDAFHLTLFNSGGTETTVTVNVDEDVLNGSADWAAWDLLSLEMSELIESSEGAEFTITLPPMGVEALRVQRLSTSALDAATDEMQGILDELQARLGDRSHVDHIDEYRETIQRAVGELRVVRGLAEEHERGIALNVQPVAGASPGIDLEIPVSAQGADGQVLAVSGTGHLLFEGEELDQSEIVDGAVALHVPDDFPLGVNLTLAVQTTNPLTSIRYISLPVTQPLHLTGAPRRIVLRDRRDLALEVSNRVASTQRGTLTIELPEGLAANVILLDLNLEPGVAEQIPFSLTRTSTEAESVFGEITVTIEADTFTETQTIPVEMLGSNASLARGDDVQVVVDSTYPGYTPGPLTDGVTDVTGVEWSEAAWASGESLTPHWILIRFPSPTEVSAVQIWWALDGGELWSSARCIVEIQDEAGQWREVGEVADDTPRESDLLTFDPVAARAVRVTQPVNGGSPNRSSLMWVREVEVR